MLATLEIDDFVDTNYGEIMVGKASYSWWVLPTKQDDVMIVVSNVVAEKNKHRDDLFIPWWKSFVNGNKVCRWLQKNPFYFN